MGEVFWENLGVRPIMRPFNVGEEEGEHNLIRVADLNHSIGEDLQELLHLEVW